MELHRAGLCIALFSPARDVAVSVSRLLESHSRLVTSRRHLITAEGRRQMRTLRRADADVVVVAHEQTWPVVETYLPRQARKVVDFQNVMSRDALATGRRREAFAWRRTERRIARACEFVTVCSSAERAAILGVCPRLNVVVAPSGVFAEDWPLVAQVEQRDIVFFGSLWYPPNQEGLRWFISKVLPRVRSEVPDARLVIYGPGDAPQDIAENDGVDVRGYVDRLHEALASHAVAIVPNVSGPGARVKLADALVSQTAAVATRIGAEGHERAESLVVCDSETDMANAIVHLLSDTELSRSIANAQRDAALRSATWQATQSTLIERLLDAR